MHGKFLTFICSCGLRKHKLKQVNDDTGTFQCNFLNLDIKLKNPALYSCISCNVNYLCFICYVKCHKNCKTKKLLTDDPNANVGKICGCGNNINHCNRFILNKFMSYIFRKQNNYDTIPYVLKIQLLNCIYDCDIYELLYSKINKFISENNNSKKIKIDEVVTETLKRLVFNITQVKQFYYFHEKTLPLDNINYIIDSINKKELAQNASFISCLMNIIVNVHFKSDFQKIKSYNYRDFLFTSLLQRIILKKKFYSKNLYFKDITEKYIINDQCIIPNLCIECLNILYKILKQSEEKDILDIFDDFSIAFEMVHFCLARTLADKKSLIKIIFILEKICIVFYSGTKNILTDGIDIFSEVVNIRKIRKIIDYISKIIYMIITNFNDTIVEEKLSLNKRNLDINIKNGNCNEQKEENEGNSLSDKFIQTLSSHSKKLFKIMSSTSIVYNTFILENKINLKDNDVLDLLDFVNQGLEAFTLIDNSYFNIFNKISFSDYYYFEKAILKLNNYGKNWEKYKFNFEKRNLFDIEALSDENINRILFKEFLENNNIVINNDDCDLYEELISKSENSNIEKTIILTCYNNKEKLETIYKLYFHSKIKFTDVDNLLNFILTNFDKYWKPEDKKVEKEKKEIKIVKSWTSSLFGSKKQEESEKDTEEIMYMDLFMEEKESLIEQKKIVNYWNKIINILKNYFPNMLYMDNILEDDKIDDQIILDKEVESYFDIILSELVLSNFDCSLIPFLIMDPVMNRYSEDTINIIFKFLLLYTLSKQSLIYLLSGNTITNIIKILDVFPLQVLQFISQITEAIYLYDIDIHQHEQIPKLLFKIYNFIKKNINLKEEYNDINNIHKCIKYTMDILYYLSPNMEIENLTSINELIVGQLQKLIDQEKILNMFPFQGLINKYQKEKMNLYFNEEEENEIF